MNKILVYVGIPGALVAFLGVQLWWAPYYIRAQVSDQVTAINDAAQKSPDITDLEAEDRVILSRLDALDAGQIRIEGKVDLFAASFMAYLERQSE